MKASQAESDPFAEPTPRAKAQRVESDSFAEPMPRAKASRAESDPFAEPAPSAPPAQPDAASAALRAARDSIQLQGMVATLPPLGARVVMAHENGRLVHRGTVAVRGPCAPSREEFAGRGLSDAHGRALEFVLAWFGSPFDSVAWDSQSGVELRWGAWPLSGPALIAALAHWKQREPEAFEARLGQLGVDVMPARPPEPASLRLLGARGAPSCEGREALTLLGEDPKRMAALAQAGRERGAQLAQLESLVAQVLRPLLASCAPGATDQESPAGPFSTARALALLLHAELRFGRRGVAKLLAHAREKPGRPASGEHAGELLAEDLRAAGRVREAAEVWRILSSPELADPP
ncbi:hypothetical protein OV207_19450 [Corallococcus sp. BB11-1]|uniref:hypothetical protein n=1 Tax=Corallococcus sp. BB11-1 TaxID=2996783 RepID=UPI002270E7A7|nr:hypothetical protein [Corallococcus sp. BB11-1]MCY1033637.1 hypothetical protein [Corallococcus sp. BB11-1]